MSKIFEILNEFWTPKFRYKGVNVNFLGLTTFKEFPQNTFKTSVRRLSKKGYIENINNYWHVTKSGQEYLKTNRTLFKFNFPKESPKNLLIIFDIPDTRRSDRDWFRKELGKAGYIMVQRSVWVGPSPLPKEFTSYIKDIKLKNCIRTFKLAKGWKN